MSRTAAERPAETVRREIWLSLVSMLRAYAHAANLHRPAEEAQFAVSAQDGSARLGCGVHRLELDFRPESGGAHWALDPEHADSPRGSFLIEENGELLFEGYGFAGQVKELDHAAMDWVALLGAAGQQPRPAGSAAREGVNSTE
jgi:hypothetical protein